MTQAKADGGRTADETIEFRNRMMAKADFEAERAGNLENELDAKRAIIADLVKALEAAEEWLWLSGWASAEPYLTTIRAALSSSRSDQQ